MNEKARYIIRIVAALFLIIGSFGFLAGAITGLGFKFRNLASFELPLGDLRGIAVDSEGNIYCGLQFYSRIQVYDPEGKFIYGKFVNSAGGAFRIRINEKDQLEVATARNDKLYVFEKDGTLVNELSDVGHYFNFFGETGEKRYHDKNKNTTYLIKWSPLGSYIVKRYSSGEEKVIIKTPFHKWLFMGPLPAWLFAMVGVVMLTLVRKNPFKNLLRRKRKKNNQIVGVFEGDMVPGESTKSQVKRSRKHKRWLLWLCCPVVVCLLLAGCVFFHLIGHHIVRWSLGHFYTPPALSGEKIVLYTDLVRLIKAHPEYSRFYLDQSGPSDMVIRDMLARKKGFLAYEVDELTRISWEFERIHCLRVDKYGSFVLFMPRPHYILPTSPGVLYSLDGRNPNEVDDAFLNKRKPFKLIKDHWYTSKRLTICPFCMISFGWQLPNSFIDLSLHDPGPGSKQTPIILWKAARSGDIKRIQSLISSGADVNAKNEDGLTPLYSALERGQKAVVELLISNEADVNVKTENGETPLHYSVRQGHADIAKLLLDNGADINAMDNAKRTPLNYALRWGKHNVAELFMSRGADVNVKDSTGGIPLHYAASRGYDNIVEQLIAKGADVNAKKANGETPLHYTSREGHVNAAELLLANGADINAKDENGVTPLHMAARQGHINYMKLLLAKGAKVNTKTKQGQTALDYALAAGRADIVELLKTVD